MIGVFDSGLGGLTVLKALIEKFPTTDFVYLGDTARLPYGTKSADTISHYTEQNLRFLKAQNVDRIVIACNSASAHFSKSSFEGIPVHTVIEPTAQKAAQVTKKKKVGLLATRATVASHAYERALQKMDPTLKLVSLAAPLLVPLAEEGLSEDPLTSLIVYRYVQPLISEGIDTLILGCTHYPLLSKSLEKATGSSISLIESGPVVADHLLEEILEKPVKAQAFSGKIQLFTTDSLGHFRSWAESILAPITSMTWDLTDLR